MKTAWRLLMNMLEAGNILPSSYSFYFYIVMVMNCKNLHMKFISLLD